jgi:membrane protein insertase Oxa1/YidC/SpoIIIJ
MIYDLLIYPLEIFLKFILEYFYNYTNDYIISVILLSLIVNFILLPAYNFSEKLQQEENNIKNKLEDKLKEFKRVFKGSELHAVTSRLYKINNYHPIYALKSLSGFMIQLPFFIGAFYMISQYEAIRGIDSYFFNDLGSPDGLIQLGSFHINIMPFIMTIINLFSVFAYTQNMTSSVRNQTLTLALVFFVLLYNSPALLLLYWSVNNIFSLVKNIFHNSVIHKELKYLIASIILLFFIVIFLIFNQNALFNMKTKDIYILGVFLIGIMVVSFLFIKNFSYNKYDFVKLYLAIYTAILAIITSWFILIDKVSLQSSKYTLFSFLLIYIVIILFKKKDKKENGN